MTMHTHTLQRGATSVPSWRSPRTPLSSSITTLLHCTTICSTETNISQQNARRVKGPLDSAGWDLSCTLQVEVDEKSERRSLRMTQQGTTSLSHRRQKSRKIHVRRCCSTLRHHPRLWQPMGLVGDTHVSNGIAGPCSWLADQRENGW